MQRLALATLGAVSALAVGAAPVHAAPPVNDDFAAATPVERTFKGTLEGATREPGEHGWGTSIWFTFRPPTPGRYAVQRVPEFAEGLDVIKVSVYTGDQVDTLRRVDVPDRRDPGDRATFEAAASTVYRIRVAGRTEYDEMEDEWEVLAAPIPANDDFANAQRMEIPGRYGGSLADATAERGEPHHEDTARYSVWYRFRTARTEPLRIKTAGPYECDASVTVYTGSTLSTLQRQIGGFPTSQTALRLIAQRDQTYWLALNCATWAPDEFELSISDDSIAGEGIALTPDTGQTVASVRAEGLHALVTTERRTTVGIALVVRPPDTRALRLEDRVIGRARHTIGRNGRWTAKIQLEGGARRALEGRRTLTTYLRLTLLDSRAPERVLIRRVKLPN